MTQRLVDSIETEIRNGMALPKCLKCGCMRDALDALDEALPQMDPQSAVRFRDQLGEWRGQLEDQQYSCAGCSYCFGAVASNALYELLEGDVPASSAGGPVSTSEWPPMPGEYFVLGEGAKFPVAISTLGNVALAEALATAAPLGVAIIGKTETENIGIDKLVKNAVSNRHLRFLMLVGDDPQGHRSGQALVALAENGVDEKMRVVGAEGRRPVLKNLTLPEIAAFREQIQVIDMIGVAEPNTIIDRVMELALEPPSCSSASCSSTGCGTQADASATVNIETPARIIAEAPSKVELDHAGYFVITPDSKKQRIIVEHYGNDNQLLHTVEGRDARSIYFTVIDNGWTTQLSHAAYLGRELEKAELSMSLGFRYVQDGI